MSKLIKDKARRLEQRVNKVRSKLRGSAEAPRIAVNISLSHVRAQAIDDTAGKTLAHATDIAAKLPGGKSEKAKLVGKSLGEALIKAGIQKAVFDRRGRLYHGRMKAVAEGLREAGIHV